ncbi:hypothetical protein ACL02P_01645 [Paenibacillus sp. MB22_1]|uniref:hypothetical protein n=1 Tax=Paenibacillus sp. MB22_1 TaxID=3383121 RepID=UPI0039A1210E
MKIVIKETGVKDTLVLVDSKTGINWAQDFIGNTGALSDGQFVYDEDKEAYLVSHDDYEFWVETIQMYQTLEDRIAELSNEHGRDAVEEVLKGIDQLDYQDEAREQLKALDEAFGVK